MLKERAECGKLVYNVKDEELELAINIIRVGSFIISLFLMIFGAV